MKSDIINGLYEADKEFEKPKDQLKTQSEHNQKEVQKIVDQQEQANIHFQAVCDKINENLDNKINTLFASFNTEM
jgi:chaperonin cofactor prefoldin